MASLSSDRLAALRDAAAERGEEHAALLLQLHLMAREDGPEEQERLLELLPESIRALDEAPVYAGVLLRLFDASASMLQMGVPALRTISWCFLPAAFSIVAGSMFQAMGNGVFSMIISIARQLLVLLPAAYLLSLSGELSLVWLAFPIAELVAVAIAAFFLRWIYKHRLNFEEAPAKTE